MAKCKEQKRKEAYARNQRTYFYSTFLNWLYWMPGGRFLGLPVNPQEVDLLVRRTRSVMQQAEGAGLKFDHANQAEGMEFWTPHEVIVFFCHGDHLDKHIQAYDQLYRQLEPELYQQQPLTSKDWRYSRVAMDEVSVLVQHHAILGHALPEAIPAKAPSVTAQQIKDFHGGS